MEPNATFLTRDWQVYAPLLYLQHVEGMRPDAQVIDAELLRRTWYLDFVARQYPGLAARCQNELDAYREQLRLFEYGEPYDAAVIQERYLALLNALLREGQPAHVGLDMEEGVGSGYVGVPLGVTVVLRQTDGLEPFNTALVGGRGLNDGTIRVDAVVKKIRRSYASVRAYRGMYLVRNQKPGEALRAWDEAAKLDPDYSLPHRLAGDLYAGMGRAAEARAAYLRALAANPDDTAAQQGLEAVGGR
jgi:tetratricopeptide (TPR) repeat protein